VQKRPIGAVDYTKGTFPWSKKALKLAKDIWGVEQWRLAQEGAINATLDGKEVVAVRLLLLSSRRSD
jgi:ATP-dependent DNA helicase Q1